MNEVYKTRGVFLDILKSFDKVLHDILFLNQSKMGYLAIY